MKHPLGQTKPEALIAYLREHKGKIVNRAECEIVIWGERSPNPQRIAHAISRANDDLIDELIISVPYYGLLLLDVSKVKPFENLGDYEISVLALKIAHRNLVQ